MDLNHVLRKFFKEMQVLKIEVAVVYLQGNKSYDAIYGINLLHFLKASLRVKSKSIKEMGSDS